MNCFQHSNKPAIGHCTYCGRGLCHECATVVEGKLSCRGECQQQIARERHVLTQSETSLAQRKTIYQTSSHIYHRQFAFLSAFGIGLLVFGTIFMLGGLPVPGAIIAGMGAIFLVNGIGMARASKKFKALATEGNDQGPQS
jgi:hypothetical protein